MRRLAFAAAGLALAFLVPGAALAAPPPPTLAVTGSGTVERAPDRVVLTFDIVTNDDRAAVATSTNNTISSALSAKLAAAGIHPGQERTTSFTINFQPRPSASNQQVGMRYGYIVSRTISVTTDAVTQVGALIDAAVSAGATDVNGVQFTLKDASEAQRAAQAAAVADARAQAEVIATAAHLRLAGVLSIDAGTGSPIIGPRPLMLRANVQALSVPTDVQPSSLSVQRSVTVVYALAP
jgi:uncharacterized protein YggE